MDKTAKTLLHHALLHATTKAFSVPEKIALYMPVFIPRTAKRSARRILKRPVTDITAFAALVRSLVLGNPLGCTAYASVRKTYPPVRVIRERYTAKFVYTDPAGKCIGTSSEVYDSVDGYETGTAAMITNLANIQAHRGKCRHLRESDLFSAILKCNDPDHGIYFVCLARNSITVASYTGDVLKKKVEAWADSVPELA